MMRETFFKFRGRGLGTGYHDDPYRYIECKEGTVMTISYECHGVEFIQAFCRRVTMDRWGVFCHDPFRRVTDTGLTRSWAEPIKKGIFMFRPTRIEIIKEQDWMREIQGN